MSRPANIHDSFFKNVLSDRRAAEIFLREHLPPDVVDLLGPELPELLPGSFVDERLGQHHTDLLFRIRLRTEQDALAYLLMERWYYRS
jgi:predicted transposase YdaD